MKQPLIIIAGPTAVGKTALSVALAKRISGEIVSTPSHSEDSISFILDNGDCFVGDLEPIDYLPAYGDNPALKADWDQVLSRHPKRIFYGHANMKIM